MLLQAALNVHALKVSRSRSAMAFAPLQFINSARLGRSGQDELYGGIENPGPYKLSALLLFLLFIEIILTSQSRSSDSILTSHVGYRYALPPDTNERTSDG